METKERLYNDPDAGNVVLRKSARCRRIVLKVHPVRGISVSIPVYMRYRDGLQFYLRKREWVLSVLKRQKEQAGAAEKDGRAVSLTGDGAMVHTLLSEIVFIRDTGCWEQAHGKVSVRVASSIVEDVKSSGRLFLSLDMPVTRKEIRYPDSLPPEGSEELRVALSGVLVKVLRDEARSLLPAKLSCLAERYGIAYAAVAVKHNSTNWGSCSTLGNINLNLNLVRLPEPVCDYVLLHELSHIRYHDHGREFHDTLERMCGDNLRRLSSLGEPCSAALLAKAARSRAMRPYSHVLEMAVKGYRLV